MKGWEIGQGGEDVLAVHFQTCLYNWEMDHSIFSLGVENMVSPPSSLTWEQPDLRIAPSPSPKGRITEENTWRLTTWIIFVPNLDDLLGIQLWKLLLSIPTFSPLPDPHSSPQISYLRSGSDSASWLWVSWFWMGKFAFYLPVCHCSVPKSNWLA